MTRAIWHDVEVEFLVLLYPHWKTELLAKLFERPVSAIYTKARALGLRKTDEFLSSPACGRLRPGEPAPGRPGRHVWTSEQVEQLAALYPDRKTEEVARRLGLPLEKVSRKARQMGLRKTDAYLASPAACRLHRGDNVGASTRFKAGQVPWNKGTSYVAGGRSAETRFKPGQRGSKWVPIGSERLSRDGYLQHKVTDTGYSPRDWVGVHILLWEEHHGPVPPGHVVVFRDGDKSRVVIENLELISRRELMARNTIHNLPPELTEVIRLRASIVRKINNRQGKHHE